MEDGGFYTCVAFNGQDRDQRWVQLRVLGKRGSAEWGGMGEGSVLATDNVFLCLGELTITGLPPSVTVPEGDTARLLCVVAGESVTIRWSR